MIIPHYKQAKRANIYTSVSLYISLLFTLSTLLLTATLPLFYQPIPLHQLATIKTHTAITTPIIITIHEEGRYQLNTSEEPDRLLSLEAIKITLNKHFKLMNPRETSICIQSTPSIPYGQVIECLDYLKQMGIQHVGLITSHHV